MLLFATTNLTTGYRGGGPGQVGGVCMGMVCDWAATSLQHDGVRYRNMLHDGKWNILQAAYHFGIGNAERWRSTAEAAGLTVLSVDTIRPSGNILDFAGAVPTWLLDDLPNKVGTKVGTWLVVMSGQRGGHATGFRRRFDNLFEFFDPNTGLWRCTRDEDFLGEVNPKMLKYGSMGLMNDGVAAIQLAR